MNCESCEYKTGTMIKRCELTGKNIDWVDECPNGDDEE